MSITKSQTEQIGSIFKGNRFVIPTYQRKYSWTTAERKALWQDIEESIKDKMNHFIGTLSFKENVTKGLSTDTTYEIIDGQQRITTLFILLKVLIDKLPEGDEKSDLMKAFIGKRDKLKLCPLGTDSHFFQQLLFDFDTIKIDEVKKRSQKFMFNAKTDFQGLSSSLSYKEIETRIIFIRDQLKVLVFNVESQAQAVKMFTIINDRGLPLRILDKTKSILMLFSTLHLSERLNDQINEAFEIIFDSYDALLLLKEKLGILGRLEENTIFTQHYYSSRKFFPSTWNNRDGSDAVFNNLKLRLDELKDDGKVLTEFIEDYLTDFQNFAKSYTDLITETRTTEEYKKPFLYLEFSGTLYPVLVRLYMQNKLLPLIPILESIEVRVYKLRGTNPIADIYWLSSELNSQDLPIEVIKDRLIEFGDRFVNDHVFKNYLNNAIYRNGAVKYILSEYSKSDPKLELYKLLQVEHIFSSNPNYDPKAYGFVEDYDYEKDRLGNLCLLEQNLNDGLSNKPPINKVSGYLASLIEETRDIAGSIQAGEYTKEQVDLRRADIVKLCISRFSYNM